MRLVNQRTGTTLAADVEVAATRRARRRGLLGRAGLATDAALVLEPCFAVHTAFMKFAIDVLFLDQSGRVTRIASLAPWRAAVDMSASMVVEMPAGAARDVRVGDCLYRSDDSV
jgi:uncharacterized membrane protein (UPF0127 family)